LVTENRKCWFGEIQNDSMFLNDYGKGFLKFGKAFSGALGASNEMNMF